MCCLFGIMDYKNSLGKKQLNRIINVLATACEARGTDATGIAYNRNGRVRIYKRPLPAHQMRFDVPDGVSAVMGHTRMTTQGSEKQNYNNHPFYGNAGTSFALAHNGVIYNDEVIRERDNLPSSHIKTDSYIGVQLIERKGVLGFESLRHMAEQLEGSFTITVMDSSDNLYIVKGDNPMCLYHYPKAGVYIYASTEEILQSALKKLKMSLGESEKISIVCGEIMRINASGKRTVEEFNTDRLMSCSYDFYPYHFGWGRVSHSAPSAPKDMSTEEHNYIDELKMIAHYFGYSDEYIDYLLEEGFAIEDIEEVLYCA